MKWPLLLFKGIRKRGDSIELMGSNIYYVLLPIEYLPFLLTQAVANIIWLGLVVVLPDRDYAVLVLLFDETHLHDLSELPGAGIGEAEWEPGFH